MRCLDSIVDSMDMNLSILWDIVNDREAWQGAVHGVSRSWTPRSDSTTINIYPLPAEEPLGSLRSERGSKTGRQCYFLFFKITGRIRKRKVERRALLGLPSVESLPLFICFVSFQQQYCFCLTRGIKLELEPYSKKQTLNTEKSHLKTDST